MHKPTSYFLPASAVEQLHGLTQDGESPRDALVRLVAQADAGWSAPLAGFAGGTDKGAYPAAGIGLTSGAAGTCPPPGARPEARPACDRCGSVNLAQVKGCTKCLRCDYKADCNGW